MCKKLKGLTYFYYQFIYSRAAAKTDWHNWRISLEVRLEETLLNERDALVKEHTYLQEVNQAIHSIKIQTSQKILSMRPALVQLKVHMWVWLVHIIF